MITITFYVRFVICLLILSSLKWHASKYNNFYKYFYYLVFSES